ncbi:MAG TPA: SRPBCC family protein [Gaiellaceae bacterium]|nr:SRPBCC family protein [Gaiellaceae bacterium]
MTAIVESIEISRRPEDVFQYVTDPSRIPEWQESAVSARREGDAAPAVGARAVVTRRVGPRERAMTMELTELNRPSSWAVRGIDGPVRGIVKGTVEPLGDGDRSRVTIALDFEGHGIGRLLVPLLVRRQARTEMPGNLQKLKARLESGA